MISLLDQNVAHKIYSIQPHHNRLIYFFAASSPEGLKNNSPSLLIDHVIKQNSSTDIILDFEGRNTENLARFYSSFGATPKKIPVYRKMWGANLLKRIKSAINTISE